MSDISDEKDTDLFNIEKFYKSIPIANISLPPHEIFDNLSSYYHPSWNEFFTNPDTIIELNHIRNVLKEEFIKYQDTTRKILPNRHNIFRIFKVCPLNITRVIIIGQDPYHQIIKDFAIKNNTNSINFTDIPVACGLAFSCPLVKKGQLSLNMIAGELRKTVCPDMNLDISTDLFPWVTEGVMLLNSALTVVSDMPGSHGELWMGFLFRFINYMIHKNENIIFVLWGNSAQKLNISDKIKVFKGSHPANRGTYGKKFIGCNHFKDINEHLKSRGETPINWELKKKGNEIDVNYFRNYSS